MTVRKNFLFDDEVAKHLEALAKERGKSQTAIVQELVEADYKTIEKRKKLEAFDGFAGSLEGAFDSLADTPKVVQSVKARKDV